MQRSALHMRVSSSLHQHCDVRFHDRSVVKLHRAYDAAERGVSHQNAVDWRKPRRMDVSKYLLLHLTSLMVHISYTHSIVHNQTYHDTTMADPSWIRGLHNLASIYGWPVSGCLLWDAASTSKVNDEKNFIVLVCFFHHSSEAGVYSAVMESTDWERWKRNKFFKGSQLLLFL